MIYKKKSHPFNLCEYETHTAMKNLLNFGAFILVLLFLQSCNRNIYTPNMHNVPLMKEKKEVQATFNFSNYQVAYGLADGLGVMLNGNIPTQTNISFDGDDFTQNKSFVELGVGHFRTMKEEGVFEIYAGGGFGDIGFDNRFGRTMDKFSTNYARYFVQPSIGFSSELFDMALAVRFVNLRFFNVDDSQYVFDESNEFEQDLSLIDQSTYTFAEPSLTIRAGWRYVKLQFQAVRAHQLNNAPIAFREVKYYLGIHLNFSKRNFKPLGDIY